MRQVSERFLAEVARSGHRPYVKAEVLGVGELDTVTDGGVTLDGSADTRGRLELTAAVDPNLAEAIEELVPAEPTDKLAPYTNEIQVWRGVDYGNGEVEAPSLGIFRIDSAATDDRGDSLLVRVTGLDRSRRFIDAKFEAVTEVAAGTNAITAIESTLDPVWSDYPRSFPTVAHNLPKLTAQEQDDRWAFAQGIAESLGMELYFDGDGTAVIIPVPEVGQVPAVDEIAEGEGGILLGAERVWEREGAFNRVIYTGENSSNDSVPRGVATDDDPNSPTYYLGPFGKVPRFEHSTLIATDAQAAQAAQGLLAKEKGTPRRVNFESLVNPALEPFDVIRVRRERARVDEDLILDQLTIPLSAEGTMGGQARSQGVK